MHFERGSMIRIAFSLDEENRPMKIFLDVCLFIYSFDRFVEQVVQLEKLLFFFQIIFTSYIVQQNGPTFNLSSSSVLQHQIQSGENVGFPSFQIFPCSNCVDFCSVRTPGGKLTFQYPKKRGTVPKCGDCKVELPGVSCLHSILRLMHLVGHLD